MFIEEVSIDQRFIDLFRSDGISELYPPQEALVNSGILDDKRNLVLCTPTASGKTIAAEIAMVKTLESGEKVVYVVPLRAIAYEKFLEFKKYETLGYRLKLEMGDLDSSKYQRKLDFDILVTTAEKCDSILRSRPEWFKDIGILVMDEVHLITTDRGPVYEILISKFQKLFPRIQILALSATIRNADELADWLNAKLIKSDWRPVKLIEDVVVGADRYEKLKEIVKESVLGGGQVLVFVNSRRGSESVAEKLGNDLSLVNFNEREELEKIVKEVLSALSNATQQCKRLAICIKNGMAFHHAGLVNKQRFLVEESFKKGLIKVITATPTLAAGVNLPARTVVIRDMKRFCESEMGYLSVLEYKQQVGRAGRPRFDKIGNAIVIARSDSEREFFIENYVNGKVEPINSKLGIEPVLRFHILASIASNFTRTKEALLEFFKSTFFGYQYGLKGFESMINRIIENLTEWNFIKKERGFLIPTSLGTRVSELYIDPRTAYNYIILLRIVESEDRFPVLGLLEMLSDAIEIPLLRVKRSEESKLWGSAYKSSDQLFRNLEGFDLDVNFLERFKTAKLFESWINELSEDSIMELYNVAPGILNQRLQIFEWLAYSASEISKILKLKNSEKEMKKLEIRIRYGVKEELIPLVGIKGIGRVRARKLFNADIKKPVDIKRASLRRLKPLVGEKIAERIKAEIG